MRNWKSVVGSRNIPPAFAQHDRIEGIGQDGVLGGRDLCLCSPESASPHANVKAIIGPSTPHSQLVDGIDD
jgi:hypothetical protein